MRERDELKMELTAWRRRFLRGHVLWSLAHHVTAFGAALASVSTGFVIQQSDNWTLWGFSRNGLSTTLSLISAALAMIAATGGFERKWRANRLSRSEVDRLRLDLMFAGADLFSIRAHLQDLIRRHDSAILGMIKVRDIDGAANTTGSDSATTNTTMPNGAVANTAPIPPALGGAPSS